MKKFIYLIDNLDKYIAIGTLSATVLLLGIQVVSRYLFRFPIAWAEEISRFTFVWAVYMGVSMAARKNEHIRVVAHLTLLFPKRISNKIIFVSDIITLTFSMILTVFGVRVLFSMVEFPFTAPVTGISMVWIYTIIPVAFLALSIRTIQIFFLKETAEDWLKQEEIGL
ncbi:TRAP transporter small permease [bacterium]|nr:TRAP transporter small permease [bacterium]